MEKIILAVIFLAGLRHSIEQWNIVILSFINLRNIYKRGFHSEDYPICLSDNCKNGEKEESQKERHEIFLKQVCRNISDILFYAVFVSGITIFAFYNYLQLTFNF